MFIIVAIVSRWVCDRNLILFGALINLSSNCWLIWFLPNAKPRESIILFVELSVFMLEPKLHLLPAKADLSPEISLLFMVCIEIVC